ncbi:DUF4175 family protein [uncultured Hyphomonas sp.]|uniref:DUF4175 domain-containing protein n=1 Tax=uncultured Hyphomonas sp. TaxID=225298 RepID=UPI002AAB92FF|nr:DUF4175 family protein [uncultured Hyphomonas sp.]
MAEKDGLKTIGAKVAATRRRLGLLAFGRAFWPLFVFVVLFLSMALAGAFDQLPASLGAVLALLFLAGGTIFLLRGVRRYSPPGEDEAVQLLDRQSPLRPVSSLSDRPAAPTRGAQALWMRHRARVLKAARELKLPNLSTEWRQLDPFRLRFILPAALIGIAVLAAEEGPGRLLRALNPDYGALVGADDMIVEAWVIPPDHTGRAPVFLKPGLNDVRVPSGSEITLRTEAPTAPRLVLKGRHRISKNFAATPDGAWEAKATLKEDARVSVRWWGERAAWRLLASPDDPPTVEFVSIPTYGRLDRTEFAWIANDDYGVVKAELAIRLQDPHPAAPDAEDRVAIPLAAPSMQEIKDTTLIDLTRHRWAGLPVEVHLVVTDASGQEGVSETESFTLPEKLFLDPYARVAQEVRVTVLREPRDYKPLAKNPFALKQDALNTEAANRLDTAPPDIQKAALMLDSVTLMGERYIPNQAYYLTFKIAEGMLESAGTKEEAGAVDPLLWSLALKAEYGSAADALRRLEAARRALEQALRDGASEEEIRRRMEAFRDAANEYLAAKMAEAVANGGEMPDTNQDGMAMGSGQSLGGQDFEDMLNALQDLTDTGATEQARQLLSDITNMLQNLEFQRGQSGSGMAGMPGAQSDGEEQEDLPPEEQEMTDAMRRLSEILREQRQLNDDTMAQQRGEMPAGEQGQSGEESGQQSGQQQGGQQGQQQGQQPGQEGQGQGGNPSEGNGTQGGSRPDGERPGTNSFAGTDEGAPPQGGGTLAERQARLGELVEQFARERGLGEGAGQEDALSGAIDPDALAAIREAQRDAERNLGRGNDGAASDAQERATQGLSELNRNLAALLDEMQRERTNQGQARNDPFGREAGGMGNNGDDVRVPEEAERQRAKDILEELRRRYNESDDEEEREYLRRLLDRF